jgi:hypothetical protein
MKEIWKAVVGYEGLYEVSSLGRVRSLTRIDGQGRNWPGRMMTIQVRGDGYPLLRLSNGVVGKSWLVHTLVLTAFKGRRPRRAEARHLDGVRANFRARNLGWGTVKENATDRIVHGTSGRGENNAGAKLSLRSVRRIRALAAKGCTQDELAAAYGVQQQAISKIVRRRRWAHVA